MVKKIFSVMLLAAALIFISGQNNFANAQDIYLGVYEDGRTGYLMDETIKYYRDYNGEYIISEGYTCTVKAINSGGNVQYINYKWQCSPQTQVLYKNGKMYTLRDMSELYKKSSHPENVLIHKLRAVWEERMGNFD